jgi:hypothetical protein
MAAPEDGTYLSTLRRDVLRKRDDCPLALPLRSQLISPDALPTTKRANQMQTTMPEHYKPPVRFGLGGVPLGNEFAVITEKDAYATLDAAWSAGVRYYDTSPWYGLGLCERRFGNFLHTKNRGDYVLSSKVGKLLKASRQNNAKEYFAFTPSPNDVVFDYTADGVTVDANGAVVVFGNSSGEKTSISFADFGGGQNARLQSFFSFSSGPEEQFAPDLSLLLSLVADKSLTLQTGPELNWRDVARVADELRDRRVGGKAVFRVDP